MECCEVKKSAQGYIRHILDETSAQKIEEHLCICESCRKHLETLLNSEGLEEIKPQDLQQQPPLSLLFYLILFIGLTIAIFILYLYFKFQNLY